MIRLAPPHFARLEQAAQLDLQVGGSEFNTAVGAARLGLRSRWVSRLPENALGRMVRNKAREQGVDTDHIVWTPQGRVGLYFAEFGAAPRPSAVLYDRQGSAMATLGAEEMDWERALEGARAFHISGITPALGAGPAAATQAALQAARRRGLITSYDLNYRRSLWSPEQARRVQEPRMPLVDVLITTEEDAGVVLGVAPEGGGGQAEVAAGDRYAAVARTLTQRFGFQAVAITLRETPSIWRNRWSALVYAAGRAHRAADYEVEVVDRIGAGDAFAAGLLAGYLQEASWERAADLGAGFSALQHSWPGDCNWATPTEVQALLGKPSLRVAR